LKLLYQSGKFIDSVKQIFLRVRLRKDPLDVRSFFCYILHAKILLCGIVTRESYKAGKDEYKNFADGYPYHGFFYYDIFIL
jgi:hypothetical protein